MMRKWYERRIDTSVSLCFLNINSQSLRFMVVAVWEHCVYHCLQAQTATTLWSLLQNFLAKKEINELHVHSSVNRNRFFTVKALIKSKKLARCKGTNDCSQILQQEMFERDLWLQGFVNVKIILALGLTEWVRTIWSIAENKNSHFCTHLKVQKYLKNAYLNLFNDLWLLGASLSKRSHLLFLSQYLPPWWFHWLSRKC